MTEPDRWTLDLSAGQLTELFGALDGAQERLRREDGDEDAGLELQTAYEELRVAAEELRVQQDHIDQLRNGQLSLRRQQERLLATSPVPAMTTGPLGIVRWANAAASGLSPGRLGRLVGKPVLALFHVDARRELRRLVATAHPDGFSANVPTSLARGAEVEVAMTASVVTGVEPQLTWLVFGHDQVPADALSHRRLPVVLARLTALSAGGGDLVEVLDSASALAKDVLGADIALTITYGSPEDPTILSSTDALAQRVDGLQLQTGEGPCVDAYAAGHTVVSEHVGSDPRWPALAALIPRFVGAAISVPLRASGSVVGALNVYCGTAGAEPARVLTAEVLAATLGAVLQEQTLQGELRAAADDLTRALASRAVIDQAKGIVMGDRGCTADEAFAHLGRLSSQRGVKVRQVAQDLVNRRTGVSGPAGPRTA